MDANSRPQPRRFKTRKRDAKGPQAKKRRMRFLLQFRGLHNDLRVPEFLATLSLLRQLPETQILKSINLTPAISILTGRDAPLNPKRGDAGAVLYGEIFFYADLLSEAEARALAARCVLIRGIYQPAAHGLDYPSCIDSVGIDDFTDAVTPLQCTSRKSSFRCFVEAFGKSYSVKEQLERIHKFSDLLRTFPGKVRMSNADEELWILEDAFPRKGHGNPDEKGPRQVFLGRKIANGQGHIGSKYSLKRRRYIGPTSMDAELAFVMANMARVKEGDLVNDPFCGTGGIMVACSTLGAHVIGGDINILALRGKGSATVAANFEQYGLQLPLGLIRADVLNSPIRCRLGGWFDAVVCDPPYGIKEGMKVFREDRIDSSLERNHFQGTQRVRFVDFLHGVLSYAADVLVEGGRLSYWLPTTPQYRPQDVPTHPALALVGNCEQPLTTRMSRRLITMERVLESVRKENELSEQKVKNNADRHVPAHYDLACKLLRQPERAEARVQSRNQTLL